MDRCVSTTELVRKGWRLQMRSIRRRLVRVIVADSRSAPVLENLLRQDHWHCRLVPFLHMSHCFLTARRRKSAIFPIHRDGRKTHGELACIFAYRPLVTRLRLSSSRIPSSGSVRTRSRMLTYDP